MESAQAAAVRGQGQDAGRQQLRRQAPAGDDRRRRCTSCQPDRAAPLVPTESHCRHLPEAWHCSASLLRMFSRQPMRFSILTLGAWYSLLCGASTPTMRSSMRSPRSTASLGRRCFCAGVCRKGKSRLLLLPFVCMHADQRHIAMFRCPSPTRRRASARTPTSLALSSAMRRWPSWTPKIWAAKVRLRPTMSTALRRIAAYANKGNMQSRNFAEVHVRLHEARSNSTRRCHFLRQPGPECQARKRCVGTSLPYICAPDDSSPSSADADVQRGCRQRGRGSHD